MNDDLSMLKVTAFVVRGRTMISRIIYQDSRWGGPTVIYDDAGTENQDYEEIVFQLETVFDGETLVAFLFGCVNVIRQLHKVELKLSPTSEFMDNDTCKTFVYCFVAQEGRGEADETSADRGLLGAA